MEDVARILIDEGASLTNSGEKKQTALHKSCAVGSYTLVKMVTYAAEQKYGRKENEKVH